MKFSLVIEKWAALSSGLSSHDEWYEWSKKCGHDWSLPLAKPAMIPMMQARRMSHPSRLAVEVALKLSHEVNIDFAIFISRHGELERTYKILAALNKNQDISPTDFALSVHNSASGLWSIIANQKIPITSISANRDGFQQALIEAYSLLHQGHKRILLVDFDGAIPEIYHAQIYPLVSTYAMGLILKSGNEMIIEATDCLSNSYKSDYPQSLAFLHGYLSKQPTFVLQGVLSNWRWEMKS